MNRKDKEITRSEELRQVFAQGKYAIVSLCRKNKPYIVTMNYGFDEEKNALYFHCALKGLKLDFLSANPNVCATVIEDRGYKKDKCDHAYRSVVFWGQMNLVGDLDEKKHAMETLLRHLEENPDPIRERNFPDDDAYRNVGILRLDIQEITGKQGE